MHAASTSEVGLSWLARLRYWAALTEILAIAVAAFILRFDLPVGTLLGLAGAMLATNVLLERWVGAGRAVGPALLGGVLVLDLLLLTAMLALSGGPSNPFTAVYLVYVTLASVLLSHRWTWSVVGLSFACFALLFLVPDPVGSVHPHHMGNADAGFSAHLWGMLVAFGLASALVATFVTRVTSALRAREADLGRVREQAARSDRLASLMTLAAGAAHELGTPLGTIALAAKELEHAASRRADPAAVTEDARLIRAEVERCRGILERLGARAGTQAGEVGQTLRLASLVDDLRGVVGPEPWSRLQLAFEPDDLEVAVPRRAFVEVLANLVRNAFEASPDDGRVELTARSVDGRVRIEVADRGHGMATNVLAHATEPFFSTKQSLGLGLFLADRFAEQLGGRLTIDSDRDKGTRVTLELPA